MARPISVIELTPEEKLLHAIFGRAGEDVKNDSLEVPSGIEGIVIDTQKFSRRMSLSEDERKLFEKELKEVENAGNTVIDLANVFSDPDLGDTLKKLVRVPLIGGLLRTMRTPAHAAGFGALALQGQSQLLRSFGIWAAFGTCLAYLLTFSLGRALLALSPARRPLARWPRRLLLALVVAAALAHVAHAPAADLGLDDSWRAVDADLVMATDPDADRVGIAVKKGERFLGIRNGIKRRDRFQLVGPDHLVDIVDIEHHLEALVATYKDKTLKELPEFEGLNPSIEHFSRIFCEQLASRIKANTLSAMTLKIWENEIAWASYQLKIQD